MLINLPWPVQSTQWFGKVQNCTVIFVVVKDIVCYV